MAKDSKTIQVQLLEQQQQQQQQCIKSIDCIDQRRLLLPDLSQVKTLVLTPETNHFRHLVAHVQTTDRVLEIGCSSGETSRLLVQYCQSWVGFDTSQEMLSMCSQSLQLSGQNTSTRIAVLLDPLVDPGRARQEARQFGDPNVVFLDIGGNRECVGVLRMVSWVLEEFEPRLVVVKSRELVNSIKSSRNCTICPDTGVVENGYDWIRSNYQKRAIPKHPLKAALVMSPADPTIPICRYHNYHKNGCKRDDCHYDHKYCHACLQLGHTARECETLAGDSTVVIASVPVTEQL